MLRAKRTKGEAVHYAVSIGKDGNVTGWSKDRGAGRALTQKEADQVKAFHAALLQDQRERAGQIAFEPVSEAELKAQLDTKQEAETSHLLRLIDAAVSPLRERVEGLEAQVEELKRKPAAVPPAPLQQRPEDKKPAK